MANDFGVPVQAFPNLAPPDSAVVDTVQMPNNNVRQAVVIADPNALTGIAPVDPILGLSVNVTGNPPVNLAQLGSVPLLGAQVVDTVNTAFRVNVVAGGAGGSGGVTPILAATLNGLTINTPVNLTGVSFPSPVNQGNPAPGLTFSWLVSVNGNTISTLQSGSWNVGITNNPDVQISGGTLTGISNTVTVAGSVNQGTPLLPILANAWPVNVVSSVPNLTLTSLPANLSVNLAQLGGTVLSGTNVVDTVNTAFRVNIVAGGSSATGVTAIQAASLNGLTITTPTVNQGTPNTQANSWNVTVNGNTITSLALVNTSSPTYGNNQQQPLSLDTSGNLRVNVVAGGAGGGVAQLQVENSAGVYTAVGYQSSPTNIPVPVQVQNGLTLINPTINVNATFTPTQTVNQGNPATGLTFSWLTSVTNNPDVQISGGTLTGISNSVTVIQGTNPWLISGGGVTAVQAATTNGLTINGTITANEGGAPWTVSVVSSVPNLTLTSLPSITGTFNQGTPASFTNAWPVVNLNGNTITVLQSTAANLNATVTGTVISNQGTPLVATIANAWPVNVVSSVPNLTLTSLPTVTITGTVASTQSGSWNVGITNNPDVQISGGTLTGISNTVTVAGTITANQGTAGSLASPWPVTNLNGNTVTVLQSVAANLQTTTTQGTPNSQANAWPVVTVNGSTSTVYAAANTSGGLKTFNTTVPGITNIATPVKITAGAVSGMHLYNPNSTDAFFQFYDATAGSVSVGVTVPKLTYWVPGLGSYDNAPGFLTVPYSTAITVAATSLMNGLTTNSTGVMTNIFYV